MRFRYHASDAQGQTQRGVIEALTPEAARAGLRARHLLPIQLRVVKRWRFSGLARPQTSRLSRQDIAIFTRQMATLLGNGVQIEQALFALEAQSPPRLAGFCKTLRSAVLDGASFSTALQANAQGFDRFYLTSMQAAERAGRHGSVLAHLADHAEARLRNRQTISLAMIYPVILILVSIAVITWLLVFLLPDIVRVFAARGADLPALTKLMIGLSDFVSAYGFALLVVLIGLIAAAGAMSQRPEVQRLWHRMLWRVGLARQVTIVEFAGTLATLTQSGVPLADALSSATATVGNLKARQMLKDTAQKVRDGAALSQALPRQQGFPPTMITIIASGEASGTLPSLLGRFAQDQAQALQARVKALVGLVEPLVLLVMGAVVMLLVLAILLPIVNLNALVG